MRVFHFILGKANKDRANGVNQVIAGLAKYSARHGAEVRIVGLTATVDFEGQLFHRDGFDVFAYSKMGKQFRESIRSAIAWADIVHLHGVFNPRNLWVAGICLRCDTPYVITLHDGLSSERLVHSRLKKRAYHFFLQRSHIEKAAGIHALTEEETTDALRWAKPAYIFCIPNGIDLEDYPKADQGRGFSRGITTIGFLGRISPEKNLETLCKAVAIIRQNNNIRLLIAGPESPYLKKLLDRYGNLGVEWVGPKYGDDKKAFLKSVDLFVHPSLCDVFSIAAIEVLATGTPLLITRSSKASYFYYSQAFFMCEPTVFGLTTGLTYAFSKRENWIQHTIRGRNLIETRLNWSVAARNLLDEYSVILKKSSE